MRKRLDKIKKRVKNFAGDFLNNYGKIFVIGCSVVLFLLSLYIFSIVHTRDKLRVTFFDVGQGDAIFIESGTLRQVMIDSGPNDIILRRLAGEMNFFDRKIDVMIETHPDADHITGFVNTLSRYEIANVIETHFTGTTDTFHILENKIDEEDAERFVAHRGDKIDLGNGTTLTFIYPNVYRDNDIRLKDTNEASIVALLNYKEINFLFMGDLPKEKENEIIMSGLVPRNVTVLKVGHHGSKTSTSDIFVNYLKPTYSILSAGEKNKYNHPNEEVVETLKKHSQNVLSTVDYGSIIFETDGYNLEIETEK